jgi:transglutaminase-like putative cysteine protease
MGDEREAERPPRSRALLLLALLALDVVAAAAFGRVFRGPGTAFRLAIAAALCLLLAGALERQHILAAVLASAFGLAAVIGLMIFPETTWHRLPTATTLRTVLESWGAVGRTAASEVAPALPLRPLVLAALTAVWAAAFSSHALGARARSPFLAILPPGALLAFATLLMNDGPRPVFVAPFLAAVLLLLYADGIRRIGHWGPVTAWNSGRGARFAASTSSRGARRVALACLAVALFMPGLLPGFRSQGLVDVHADTDPSTVSINPLVDIRPRLLQQRAVTLFTVRSEQAAYWRSVALEHFDGRIWHPSESADVPQGIPVESGTPLRSTRRSIESDTSQRVVQAITVARLVDPWLPAAYDPIQVSSSGPLRYDPRTSTLISPDGLGPGYSYTVVSSAAVPTSEDLNRLGPVGGIQAAQFLQLPDGLPPEIPAIAHRLSDDQPTPYLKILAIQQHLRSFRYDLNVRPTEGVDDIVNFLTVTKAGYCQQFAGTMAVLLRSLGIPARVVVGFIPGVRREGAWRVSTHESHAWVEVLFPTYGWLAFEPTPTRYNPGATSYALVQRSLRPAGQQGGQGECGLTIGPGPILQACPRTDAGSDPTSPETRPPGRGDGTTDRPEGTRQTEEGRGWRSWLLPGGLGLLALLALLIPVSKLARRRLALARARDPRDQVLATYRVMTDQAADLGLARHDAETFREYRIRLKEGIPELDGDLDSLTRLAGRAAYSEAGVTAQQAREAGSAARATVKQLGRATGGRRRVAGWFRLEASRLRRWTAG